MYTAEVLEERRSCVECPGCCGFRNLPGNVLADLELSKRENHLANGEILYRQGEKCTGLFILCQGRVKLSKMSTQGKTAILQVCGPGDLLGVSEVLANCAYAATAQVQEESVLEFVPREKLLKIMARHAVVGLRISEHLSAECLRAFQDLSLLRTPSSALQKLSRLLLRWTNNHSDGNTQEIPMIYTHAELAQLIGTSRETVTRLLTKLENDEVLRVQRRVGHVLDAEKLRSLASAA